MNVIVKKVTNSKDQELFYGVEINEVSQVRKVLGEGANVNARDKGSSTPLMRAAVHGSYLMSAMLLQEGADVNATETQGWSALHFAAQKHDEPVTRLLLDLGANVNAQDSYGNTPLVKAVLNCQGRGEIVTLLLSRGADPNIENKSGISAVKLAQTISNYNVKQFFE